MIVAFVVGFLLSFFGSIPIAGPIAVTVLSLGFAHRRRSAMFVAIGAGFAEGIWAFAAFWGFSTALERFPRLLPISRLFGCVVLLVLGVYLIVRRQRPMREPERKGTQARSALVGFTLTIVNPTLLVTWTAAVSAAHASGILRMHPHDAWPFACAVTTGVIAWFSMMLALLHVFHRKLEPTTTDKIIRATGVVVTAIGVALVVRTILHWH